MHLRSMSEGSAASTSMATVASTAKHGRRHRRRKSRMTTAQLVQAKRAATSEVHFDIPEDDGTTEHVTMHQYDIGLIETFQTRMLQLPYHVLLCAFPPHTLWAHLHEHTTGARFFMYFTHKRRHYFRRHCDKCVRRALGSQHKCLSHTPILMPLRLLYYVGFLCFFVAAQVSVFQNRCVAAAPLPQRLQADLGTPLMSLRSLSASSSRWVLARLTRCWKRSSRTPSHM